MKPSIKGKALVVLFNADRTAHAVTRSGPDAENPQGYDRFLGGTIEFGELAADAAVREIREELGAAVENLRLLDVVENIFSIDGQPGHEIVFVYSGGVPEGTVPPEGDTYYEDSGAPMEVRWRPVGGIDGIPLYPGDGERLVRLAL